MNTNPYLKRLEELEAARKAWDWSEWLLNILRTESCHQPKQLSEEELLVWMKP